MKSFSIDFPNEMTEFLNKTKVTDILNFKRAAFLLYAYIDEGKLSHGKAAELLGVDKFDLIDFYDKYGLKYIKYSLSDYAEKEKQLFEDFGLVVK